MTEDEEQRELEIDAASKYQGAYKQTFGTPWGQTVLRDLSAFCCANITTVTTANGVVDPYASVANSARREVFLRIQRVLNLTPEELISLARGRLGVNNG